MSAPRPVEGERKFATVLFADVARSTEIAERLDPEDWAAIMNGAFGFMNTSITRYGGTVGRLMGDGVLAFFGAPVALEDHAERALLAGLEIRDAAEEYGRRLTDRFGIDFGIRVGIHSGFAVLAYVGDQIKAEYTAMGDTANVAARLQAAGAPGMVLVSGDTHRLVRGRFEVRPHGFLELRGKEVPVEVWQVTAARPERPQVRGLEGLASPLVGRREEQALLGALLDSARAGSGGAALVVGEAGLGKSRLVADLRHRAEEDGSAPVWFEGRAVSYGRSLAYHPWQQIGRSVIGALPDDGPGEVRRKLHEAARRWSVSSEDLPFLETMLAVETEEGREAIAHMEGAERLRRIGDAVRAFLMAHVHGEGKGRAHVLVFDDLHWADPASVDLLVETSSLALSEPLLFLCVFRPDKEAPSASLRGSFEPVLTDRLHVVTLEPLGVGEARELLGNLLHVEDLPERIRELILQRSEGNPFFLEEVLRSLIDTGHIVREADRWRAAQEIAGVQIPETLEGVLSARIDRLPDPTKQVAQTAAVLGRIFAQKALARVCREAPTSERIEDVDPHLGTLAYEELVRERARTPEREYIFKHAMTQEAAYGLLLRRRRRALHARAGAALEELYPERIEELTPILAHHFFEGGDPARAVPYSLKAAARAQKLFALPSALGHYERALSSLAAWPDAPPSLFYETVLGWTWVRHKLNDYEGVVERLQQAEEMARALDDKGKLATILTWIANVHIFTGFPSRAMPLLLESQTLASELGDEHLMLVPYFFATESMLDREPREAAIHLERVVEQARRYRAPEVEAHALATLAVAHARLGDFDEADKYIALALEAAPRSGAPVKEADVHIAVGYAYHDMGEVEKALEHSRIGAEKAHAVDAVECACAGYFGVGLGNLEQRELEAATEVFTKSLRLADFSGWEGYVNRIRAGIARTEVAGGSVASVTHLEAALRNARDDRDLYGEATVSEMLASSYLEVGDPAAASSALGRALEMYRNLGMKAYEARALELAARIAAARGDPAEEERLRAEAAGLRGTFRKSALRDPTDIARGGAQDAALV